MLASPFEMIPDGLIGRRLLHLPRSAHGAIVGAVDVHEAADIAAEQLHLLSGDHRNWLGHTSAP
jgi:hypothetical protein